MEWARGRSRTENDPAERADDEGAACAHVRWTQHAVGADKLAKGLILPKTTRALMICAVSLVFGKKSAPEKRSPTVGGKEYRSLKFMRTNDETYLWSEECKDTEVIPLKDVSDDTGKNYSSRLTFDILFDQTIIGKCF